MELNLVTKQHTIKPNYKQDLSIQRVIDFYYLENDMVLLEGSMDGQFPYWISITAVDDTKTNAEILERVLFDEFTIFTTFLPEVSEKKSGCYHRRIMIQHGEIETPFNKRYLSDPRERKRWGHYLAEDIKRHDIELKDLCKWREMDGKYLDVLKEYLTILESDKETDPVRKYQKNLSLIKIMEYEDYLYRSQNQRILSTYQRIREVTKYLYNRYMDVVR
ncbi:hypothetical protein [Guggenheimella bovis]